MKVSSIVLDSAPIITSSLSLGPLSDNFYTVPEVLKELKDKTTRDNLGNLPYLIQTKSPSEESIKTSKSVTLM